MAIQNFRHGRTVALLSAGLLVLVGVVLAPVVADRLGVSLPWTVSGRTRLTLTTGSLAGRRNEIAEAYLAPAARQYGLNIQIKETIGSEDSLDKVNAGAIDLALVGGGLNTAGRDNVREIIPLYVEPLHLLLSPGLAALPNPNGDLASLLRNHSISLDLVGTGTHTLVAPPDGLLGQLGISQTAFVEMPESLDALAAPSLDCGALPDAIFVLGPLPHPGARNLVTQCNYRLHPMAFADALHLANNRIYPATIPPATYRLDPAEPATTLQTFGTRLLLVANQNVSDNVVQKLLGAILETSFSHLYDPPIDINQLSTVPEYPQHTGVAAYIANREPVTMQALTTATRFIALITTSIPAVLIVYRMLRRWRIRHRMSDLQRLMADVADIEQTSRDLEGGPVAILQGVGGLRSKLLSLRTIALHKSSNGELQHMELLPAFLDYIAHVSNFLDTLTLNARRDGGPLLAEADSEPAETTPARGPAEHVG